MEIATKKTGTGTPEPTAQGTGSFVRQKERLTAAMITYIFPPNYGGAAIQALELAKTLKRLNVNSFFVAANLADAPDYEEIDEIPIYRYRTVSSPRFSYLFFMLRVLALLIKKRRAYDVVHFHSIKPFSFLITALAKILGKPTLVSLSLLGNDDPGGLKAKSLMWAIEAHMYKKLDRVNCVSTALMKSCLNEGILSRNISLIPYGVDEHKFKRPTNRAVRRQIRKELGLPDSAFICLFVGRISQRKGCDLLFEAWKRILQENQKDFFLILVGPYGDHVFMTEEGQKFDRRVQEYAASADEMRMKFTGQISIEETARYFQVADGFVFPSRNEGFGIVVIEAMACGIPVVATRIPDVTEDIIDDRKDGVILDSRDPQDLASAIIELQQDRHFYDILSRNALEKVKNKFTLSSVAARHVMLYEQLLINKRKNGSNGV